jgi:prepilin-type N-terminal cleavage/methylation domain-containing protein
MRQLRKICGGHSGLTLMELMVVIAILSIMAGMTMSALGNYIPDYRLQSAARELYATMHEAKMEAIKRNDPVRVVFDVSNERYAISLNGGSDDTLSSINDNENLKIISLSKYNQVSFGAGTAAFDATDDEKSLPEDYISFPHNLVTFADDGTANPLGYVYLESSENQAYAIGTLLTGVILLKKWEKNGWVEFR